MIGGAAGLLAATIPGRRSPAQSPAKLAIGRVSVNALTSTYIGQVDFFRDEGVAIEPTRFDNAGQMFQAMAGSNITAGEVGLAPTIIALTRGLPFIAPFLGVCSTPERPYERDHCLVELPDHHPRRSEGKKMAFQGPGTVPDMLLGALPQKRRIRKEDIQLVPMPPPNQPDTLGQGLVDAIFAIPPADTVAERKYGACTVADATELVPYSGLPTFTVRRDFADRDPQTVQRLLPASIRFLRWIDDNPAPARDTMGKNLGLPEELATGALLPVFARNGLPVMPNVWRVYYMLVEAKTIDPHPDPAKIVQ